MPSISVLVTRPDRTSYEARGADIPLPEGHPEEWRLGVAWSGHLVTIGFDRYDRERSFRVPGGRGPPPKG
jgi:hypothetical protein